MTYFDQFPKAGDPTLVGWGITVLYFVAAVVYGMNARQVVGHSRRRVWYSLAILFILMGLNKQLDMQTGFNAVGRFLFISNGWYELRQGVKNLLLVAMVTYGAFFFLLAFWALQGSLREHSLAVIGLLVLFGFVVLRAGYLYHVPLIRTLGGMQVSWMLEPLGLVIMTAAAWQYRRRSLSHEAAT